MTSAQPPARRHSTPPFARPDSFPEIQRVVVGQWGRTYAEAFQGFCHQAFPHATVTIGCSGAEILAAVYARAADLLLLGLNLPDMYGIDLLRRITQEKLAVRVLVACLCHDERSLLALRDAQFDGLLDLQQESTEALVRALRLVAAGQPYVSAAFRDTVVDRGNVSTIWQKLTPAEIRVFTVIGDGSGNGEAARELGLTESTVQTHRRNLMHKLGIPSSAKLVREAIRLGIVRINVDGRVIRAGTSDLIPQARQA